MFKVLRNGLPRYIFFTHAPTSNVKPPGTRLLEAPSRWSPLEAPLTPPWNPLQGEAPLKPPSSPLEEAIHCVAFWTLVTSQLCNSSGSNNNQLQPTATYNNQQHFDLQTFVPRPPPRPQTLQAPLKGASEGGTSEPAPSAFGPPVTSHNVGHTLQGAPATASAVVKRRQCSKLQLEPQLAGQASKKGKYMSHRQT